MLGRLLGGRRSVGREGGGLNRLYGGLFEGKKIRRGEGIAGLSGTGRNGECREVEKGEVNVWVRAGWRRNLCV